MKKIILLLLFILVLGGCTSIDYSCQQDTDCEVKNVGNRCGGYLLCVNSEFEPNPPELYSSDCGFKSVEECECVQNRCEGKEREERR